MPVIGYGTFDMTPESIRAAIVDCGYRHLDTASYYNNEEMIGQVLQDVFKTTSIKRSDMFITTKVWNHEKENIQKSLRESLARLRLDYVDLYLIHWPVQYSGFKVDCTPIKLPLHKQWPQMEECQRLGLTRSIGVSNFNFQLINDLLTYAEIRPVANQIEISPYLSQFNLIEWMKKEGIVPIAFCPLGGRSAKNEKENFLFDEVLVKIAANYGCTTAQVVLAWGRQRGHVSLPKSSDPTRMRQNIESLKVQLTEEEIQEVNGLNKNRRTVPAFRIPGLGYYPIFE